MAKHLLNVNNTKLSRNNNFVDTDQILLNSVCSDRVPELLELRKAKLKKTIIEMKIDED